MINSEKLQPPIKLETRYSDVTELTNWRALALANQFFLFVKQ